MDNSIDSKKCVVVYSGGLDSTVLLTKCKGEFDEVVALNFSYGSKHNYKERKAARKVCEHLQIPLFLYDLPSTCSSVSTSGILIEGKPFLKSDLLKSGGDVPEGHYEDVNMKRTVVPYRNSIMLSIAAGFAESIEAKYIAVANHAGDHAIYKDCRKEYIEAFAEGIKLGGYGEVIVYSPFVDMSKVEIVKLGSEINAPMELSWSCYKGGEKHCKICGTCSERVESFLLAGVPDPTEYDT